MSPHGMSRPPTSSGFRQELDGFTPIGPCIVTADEFDTYPAQAAHPVAFVNGEKRQDSNTSLQIFDIDHVIAELSQGMTLKAGTIIATGTPAGVGMGMSRPASSNRATKFAARSRASAP